MGLTIIGWGRDVVGSDGTARGWGTELLGTRICCSSGLIDLSSIGVVRTLSVARQMYIGPIRTVVPVGPDLQLRAGMDCDVRRNRAGDVYRMACAPALQVPLARE